MLPTATVLTPIAGSSTFVRHTRYRVTDFPLASIVPLEVGHRGISAASRRLRTLRILNGAHQAKHKGTHALPNANPGSALTLHNKTKHKLALQFP